MSLNQFPYQNFEACKTSTGAEFFASWRALAIQDPQQAAGVLLHVAEENMRGLSLEDWASIEPYVLKVDSERVLPAILQRWAMFHEGAEFLSVWLLLLEREPERARFVLEMHSKPNPGALSAEQWGVLMHSSSHRLREAAIRLFGMSQQAGSLDLEKLLPQSRVHRL